MSERIDVAELEQLDRAATSAPWTVGEPWAGFCRIYGDEHIVLYTAPPDGCCRLTLATDHAITAAARNALPAFIRLARAAARINELVGTETEEGQDVAWEELDAALAAFDFRSEETA